MEETSKDLKEDISGEPPKPAIFHNPPPSLSSFSGSSSTHDKPIETSPQGRYVKLDERLGSGAYKDVWRAYDTHEGIEVAWNVVKLSKLPPSERKRIKTEVILLKDIEHKNVIKYYNSWVDREREQIVFVTEIMSSGSLKDYLRKNPMIRWKAVKRWCIQILEGLTFLHSKHIIHRDIKCDNIFINGYSGDLRIGDLGLSTKISEDRPLQNSAMSGREVTSATMTCLGTPEFMAPELYDLDYDEKVDIYAFGMTTLEMVTALTPFHECTSAAQIYKKVLNGEMPPELELVTIPSAKRFIQRCLQPSAVRPSASTLLEDPFIQDNESEDLQEVRTTAVTNPMGMIQETNEEDVYDEDDNVGEESESEMKHLRGAKTDEDVVKDKDHVGGVGGGGEGPKSEKLSYKTASRENSGQFKSGKDEDLHTSHVTLSSAAAAVASHHSGGHSSMSRVSGIITTEALSPNSKERSRIQSLPVNRNKEDSPDHADRRRAASDDSKEKERLAEHSDLNTTVPLRRVSSTNANSLSLKDTNTPVVGGITVHNDPERTEPEHASHSEVKEHPSSPTFHVPLLSLHNLTVEIPTFPNSVTGGSMMDLESASDSPAKGSSENGDDKEFGSGSDKGSNVRRGSGRVRRIKNAKLGTSQESVDSSGTVSIVVERQGTLSPVHSMESEPSVLTSTPPFVANIVTANASVSISDLEDHPEHMDSLMFKLHVIFDDECKEIEFEFDLTHDDAQIILEEMRNDEELKFLSQYSDQLISCISRVVNVAREILQEEHFKAMKRLEGVEGKSISLAKTVIQRLHILDNKHIAQPDRMAGTSPPTSENIVSHPSSVSTADDRSNWSTQTSSENIVVGESNSSRDEAYPQPSATGSAPSGNQITPLILPNNQYYNQPFQTTPTGMMLPQGLYTSGQVGYTQPVSAGNPTSRPSSASNNRPASQTSPTPVLTRSSSMPNNVAAVNIASVVANQSSYQQQGGGPPVTASQQESPRARSRSPSWAAVVAGTHSAAGSSSASSGGAPQHAQQGLSHSLSQTHLPLLPPPQQQQQQQQQTSSTHQLHVQTQPTVGSNQMQSQQQNSSIHYSHMGQQSSGFQQASGGPSLLQQQQQLYYNPPATNAMQSPHFTQNTGHPLNPDLNLGIGMVMSQQQIPQIHNQQQLQYVRLNHNGQPIVDVNSQAQMGSVYGQGMSPAIINSGSYEYVDNQIQLEILDVEELKQDPEFIELENKLHEALAKVEKEYSQKLAALQVQKEKIDETYRREAERLQARRHDLDQQLENLQEKFRERMGAFDQMRKQVEESHTERKRTRMTIRRDSKEVPVSPETNQDGP